MKTVLEKRADAQVAPVTDPSFALDTIASFDPAVVITDIEMPGIRHRPAPGGAQTVDNLVSNALTFTPSGGIVTVSLRRDGDAAVVAVTDTGIGIPAVELSQLSQRFFRASTATRNAVPGVGLGLTITKAIVTAHGGRLDVASEEGVGTSISLHLPIETPAPVAAAVPGVEAAS